MSTNNRGGNPHEINAYNIGRVAYSVEAIDIIATRVGRLYNVNPDAVFVKMLSALEDGNHPYLAGVKFALARRGGGEPARPAPSLAPEKAKAVAEAEVATGDYGHDY